MQVFIIGTPLATAMALDRRRLNKQIIECQQILDALRGKSAWRNHPCVLQYRGYEEWLVYYFNVLVNYRRYAIGLRDTNYLGLACIEDMMAKKLTPPFHTQEYFDQMRRRLYTKDHEHYRQWAELGESACNWYFVDGEWRKYINGKRIE
jgi:hypothetical protein